MKSIHDFLTKKKKQQKITMLTCYDYSFAKILADTDIDCLLVGDSVAQVFHGYSSTLYATTEMMALHTQAVSKAAGQKKFIVTDMPFLSTRKKLETTMNCVQTLMTSGAQALKIEGGTGHIDTIKYIIDSGIPVMGHLGLTPQSIHQLGGPKIQGKTEAQAEQLLEDSLKLQEAGCFALVLELVPAKLAEKITTSLAIPTIGIGAGSQVSGQVLVLNDLLGMNKDFNPKFLKKYADLHSLIHNSVQKYCEETLNLNFPSQENTYSTYENNKTN